ncbi:uncharacterized protein LOC133179404 [Saccostrea echinata]|uniref:uncharacterized protein LOC133179404 n=1 Tax=Saccostrea echinata TaxID=191078 RepID=UPI002A8305F9|nr:uncharacterized protein LOC133179404 [Saccostrea echinata]
MADKAYEYDLFIIHSSENSAKATELMMDLENRFKVKCCFADREFLPGTEIIENISNFMDKSDKILVLLSPASVSSGWCWQELQEAFRKNVQERRNCIIPVMLEDTEVPKLLRNMTYIDFQKEADLAEKIYKTFTKLGSEKAFISDDESLSDPRGYLEEVVCAYDDDFSDSEERLEFLKEEANISTLQNYFDEAARKTDLELCQCILENNHTALSSKNIFNFCVHFPKEQLNQELANAVFQKREGALSFTDFKNSYLVACSRDIPCLVTEFNKLGCKKLINASFVGNIIPGIPDNSTVENETLTNILKEMKWNDEDVLSFLEVAIQSRKSAVIKVLLSLISTIPFQTFYQLIFVSDEETCTEVLHIGEYKEEKGLRDVLFRACLMDMKILVKEILRQGVKLQPNFLDRDFNFGIVEILIQEYSWNLEELREIEKFLMWPKCRRLLQKEIQIKLNAPTDKCSVLYDRNACI